MGGRVGAREDRSAPPRWGIVYGAAALLLVGGARALVDLAGYSAACPFLAWTGEPCPTCYGLRALSALGRGDVGGAIAAHPLLTVASLAVLAWGTVEALSLFAREKAPLTLGRGGRKAIRWAVPFAIAANWIYLVWRH